MIHDPTTALGNWHVNLLFFHHFQLLLFVSDLSRLAVVTPARETRSLASHHIRYLSALLESFEIPQTWIDAEIREMAEVHFARTRSRSVLGTMNDYKYQIEVRTWESEKFTPLEMSLDLSRTPVGPIQWRNPREVAYDLLKARFAP